MHSTSLYKKSKAYSAWLCVLLATYRSWGQHGQKCLHLGGSQVFGVTDCATRLSHPAHEKTNLIELIFIDIDTIVSITQTLLRLV